MDCRISDYGLIGNARSAALVSKNGGIDWCCLPEFDSPAIFAAILDRKKGGHFTIWPEGEFQSTQAYIKDTNILETHFSTQGGEMRLSDAFTVADREFQKHNLRPDHEILRVVEGITGEVEMTLWFEPKIFYGSKPVRLEDREKLGIQFFYKEGTFILQTTLAPEHMRISEQKDHVTASFTVEAGTRITFSLSMSSQSPAIIPELKETGGLRLEKTKEYWQNWIGKSSYTGIYMDEVRRSALALKLLSHAPSGAIVAAPTTSLPESPAESETGITGTVGCGMRHSPCDR